MNMLVGWVPSTKNFSISSTRNRCLNFIDHYKKIGRDVEIFDKEKQDQYDIVIFCKNYSQESVELINELKARGCITILDICDNHLYNPNKVSKLEERSQAVIAMLDAVDAVTFSTVELKRQILLIHSLDKPMAIVPDPIDDYLNYNQKPRGENLISRLFKKSDKKEPLKLVWFGNHGDPVSGVPCGMEDLLNIREQLEEINKKIALKLTVISNSREKYDKIFQDWKINSEYIDWNIKTFSGHLKAQDIFVLPISKNPFTLCKTNIRLITAILHGLGVVADEIPEYTEFRNYCILNDWDGILKFSDKAYRKNICDEAKIYIRRHYDMSVIAQLWLKFFEKLLEKKNETRKQAA